MVRCVTKLDQQQDRIEELEGELYNAHDKCRGEAKGRMMAESQADSYKKQLEESEQLLNSRTEADGTRINQVEFLKEKISTLKATHQELVCCNS